MIDKNPTLSYNNGLPSVESLKSLILERLAPLKINKVMLFGSHATGNATAESDVDIYVVTSDEIMPQSFREKQKLKLKVLNALFDLRSHFPMDVIVHSRPMHQHFLEQDSSFAREIMNTGIPLK